MASTDRLKKGNLTPAVSYLKITLIVLAVTITVSTILVGAFLVYEGHKQKSDNVKKVEQARSHYADGYFPELKKPKPIEAEVITHVEPPLPAVEEKPATEVKTYQVKNKPVKPEPTQEELLLKEQLRRMKVLEAKRKALVLSSRRQDPPQWGRLKSPSRVEIEKRKKAALKSPTDKDFSDHDLEKDISTFPVDLSRTITEGRSIPCATKGEINSQIEGSVTCVVKSNVYGFHGRNILIPAGTEAHGKHGSLKKVGDERFNIVWHRFIRPDGVNIMLTDAGTSDRVGATGIQGDVNKRFAEKYGAALLTSTLSAAAQMSIPMEGSNNTRVALESYGTDLGRVSAAMIQETINIKPFAKVPSGTVINIRPTTDIWLKNIDKKAMFSRVSEEQK